ncbi:MAG: BsaWI family type II restriction enzyme [Candidatus Anstonellales archaeon]
MDFEKKWQRFLEKYGSEGYEKVDAFLTDLEREYKNKKIKEFMQKGSTHEKAINKARQSWVAYVGRKLEEIVMFAIEPTVKKYGANLVSDKELRRNALTKELDSVRRALLVHFDRYSYLPDADIVVYRFDPDKAKADVLAILSVKNSFRERYTETPYWKIKLSQSDLTRRIKVFMVTTDRDDEISHAKLPSKARVVLSYELDGVYITKNDSEIDSDKKVGNIKNLIEDLENLLKIR